MGHSIVLVLGVCVFSAHTAVPRTQDARLNRIVRSPHYGSSYDHDDFDLPPPPHGPPPHHGPPPSHGPPPPPIVYHTQNWSGVAKGFGGAPQGVFSGAAASAQSAAPALSEVFSIAASGSVTSDEGGQVTENIDKSGFDGHSKFRGSESYHSDGSVGNKLNGALVGSSNEGQYSIKSSGLALEGGVSGVGSQDSESKSGQFNTGAIGVDKKPGEVSAGYSGSSGQFKSVNFDRESGQRSINSGFSRKPFGGQTSGYGSQSSQYGSFEGADENGSRGDIGSETLNNGNSAGSTSGAFGSQKGKYNFQKSEAEAGINRKSGEDNENSGFGSNSASNQFGQYSGSGYQGGGSNRRFESHGGGYGPRRQFENPSSGYGSAHGYHRDDHRYGKSHQETPLFEQNSDQFGYQGSTGQGLGDNGQSHSTGFSNSRSSSFGSARKNYESGLSNSEADNLDQVEQSRRLDTGLSASQTGSPDFSGSQQVKQSGQLDAGFSASQAGSQGFSGGLSQSNLGASGYEFKKSGSLNSDTQGALFAGNANSGNFPPGEAKGSLSANVGASGQEDVQSTLGSALNLASQGLQAAQQTPCSTCNKGSYALSNAKSHSGSAIALSIGG